MERSTSRAEHAEPELGMAAWARRQAPDLAVLSTSEPGPILRRYNLVAKTSDPAVAREVVRAWESIEVADSAVGLIVLGSPARLIATAERAASRTVDVGADGPGDAVIEPVEAATTRHADPEGIARHTGTRVLVGAIPGAVVGAAIVLAIVAATGGEGAGLVISVVAGAALGAVMSAVAAFVIGTGWSTAYQETFVDAASADLVFASFHSESSESFGRASEVAARYPVEVFGLHRDGSSIAAPSPRRDT